MLGDVSQPADVATGTDGESSTAETTAPAVGTVVSVAVIGGPVISVIEETGTVVTAGLRT